MIELSRARFNRELTKDSPGYYEAWFEEYYWSLDEAARLIIGFNMGHHVMEFPPEHDLVCAKLVQANNSGMLKERNIIKSGRGKGPLYTRIQFNPFDIVRILPHLDIVPHARFVEAIPAEYKDSYKPERLSVQVKRELVLKGWMYGKGYEKGHQYEAGGKNLRMERTRQGRQRR